MEKLKQNLYVGNEFIVGEDGKNSALNVLTKIGYDCEDTSSDKYCISDIDLSGTDLFATDPFTRDIKAIQVKNCDSVSKFGNLPFPTRKYRTDMWGEDKPFGLGLLDDNYKADYLMYGNYQRPEAKDFWGQPTTELHYHPSIFYIFKIEAIRELLKKLDQLPVYRDWTRKSPYVIYNNIKINKRDQYTRDKLGTNRLVNYDIPVIALLDWGLIISEIEIVNGDYSVIRDPKRNLMTDLG